jgi:hypothetical protein
VVKFDSVERRTVEVVVVTSTERCTKKKGKARDGGKKKKQIRGEDMKRRRTA